MKYSIFVITSDDKDMYPFREGGEYFQIESIGQHFPFILFTHISKICLKRVRKAPLIRKVKPLILWHKVSLFCMLLQKDQIFLVSRRDLACQQEVSLALTKTPPIHYSNVVDSAFSNYAG